MPCADAGKTPGAQVVYICTLIFVVVVAVSICLIKRQRAKFEKALGTGVQTVRHNTQAGRKDDDLIEHFEGRRNSAGAAQANSAATFAKTGLQKISLLVRKFKTKFKITLVSYQLVSAVGFNCDVSPRLMMRIVVIF